MHNPNIKVSFENRLLSVMFLEDAVITAADLEEIYRYAAQQAKGKKYCALYKALNHYEVTDDGIQFLIDNPYNKDIIAKAYVLNTKEAEQKTKLHMLFDKPALKPYTFGTTILALNYLRDIINKSST